MAPDTSPRRGSSFETMWIRTGNLPVHWSRYLRLTVSVSSPVIDRRRSTTMLEFLPPPERASLTMASDFPSGGANPNSPPSEFKVARRRYACQLARSGCAQSPPAPTRWPHHYENLVQVELPADDVAEPLAEHVNGV